MKAKLILLGRFLLGAVFIYAGTTKLSDPRLFADAIGRYHLLPYPGVVLLAMYLPWLELVCGFAILFRRRNRGALLLSAGMCLLFSLALASAWQRGLNIECGCFGAALPSSVPMALLRALILGAVGLGLFFSSRSKPALIAPSLPDPPKA